MLESDGPINVFVSSATKGFFVFDRALLALPHVKAALALLMLCSLVQAGTVIGQAIALGAALSGIWGGASLDAVFGCLIAFAACYGGRQILLFARDGFLDRFSRMRASELRSQLLETIFEQPVGIRHARRLGESAGFGDASADDEGSAVLADSVIQGVDLVETYIRTLLPKMSGIFAVTVPILASVFALDWVSGVILLVLCPVIVLFMVLIGRSAKARAEKQYRGYQVLSNHFIDTLRGIRTLRVFGVGPRYADVVHAVSERFRKATMRTIGVATLSSAVLDLVATAGVAAVAIMLGMRLISGDLALFTGLTVLILAPEYFRPIREFASDFHASLDGKNALSAIQRAIGATAAADGEPSLSREGGISCQEDAAAWNGQSTLSLHGVSYAYSDAAPVLRDVTLDLHGYERVGIVGPSGAGKTTIVDLIGGFKMPTAGGIEWNGMPLSDEALSRWRSQIVYIPQHPYIFHATLRENIVFYHPEATDEAVDGAIRAMGLEQLVAQLPEGLDTVIGEGGRAISGGQAQRIALARALLDPCRRILLFDEPTAHLDIETELELKQMMLPLMRDRLVVFATHRRHWMADMDRILMIEDGEVREVAAKAPTGTAMAQGGPAGNFAVCASAEDASASPSMAESGMDAAFGAASGADAGHGVAAAASGADAVGPLRMRWARKYVSANRKLLVIACILGVASFACAALLMFASGFLIGRTAEPGAELFAIMTPMAFVQLFGVGKPVTRYIQRLVSHDWVFRVTSDLRRRLYLAVERHAMDPARSQTSGDYLGMLSDDIGHLQNLVLRVAMPAAVAMALSVVMVLALAFVDWAFACGVLLVFATAVAVVPLAARFASRARTLQVKRSTARLYDSVTDNVFGSADWVLSGRGAQFCERSVEETSGLAALRAQLRMRRRTAELIVKLLFGVLACGTVMWAQTRFGCGIADSPGGAANWAIAFTLGVFPLVEAYVGLPEAAQSFDALSDSLDRLGGQVEQSDDAEKAVELEPPERLQAAKADSTADSAAPALAFEDVFFAYDGSSRPAIEGLSLSIPAGQKIAILGRSGAGKSTLLGLARGDLLPQRGGVYLHGCPIGDVAEVHRHIGVVAQDAYLFNQTLRENLAVGRVGIADDDMVRVLYHVGLGPLFESLPHGLDTLAGEMGARFSGGERQRIALARVLLSSAQVILFDEPAVGLDPETEHALHDAIFAALSDRTLVMVTHHLQEADRFDRVVFIENGRVAMDGAPDALACDDARYRRLLAFDR